MANRLIVADLKSSNDNGLCPGHYFSLAQNYCDIFDGHCEIKIAGGPIYTTKFSKEDLVGLPCDFIEEDSKFKNLWRMLCNGWSLFRQVNPDDVIIIQDSQPAMILFVLLLTCFHKGGVFQIHYSEEPCRRFYYRVMLWLKRKYIKGTICPNEAVGKAYGVPYIVVPDYIYCEKSGANKVSYGEKTYDFCSIGRIEPDKGVCEAVKTLAGKNVSYLVAGLSQSPSDEAMIREVSDLYSNITVDLNYLTDQKFRDYLLKSRYCLLNYHGSYCERSSGVVLDTLFSGVPVVGSRCKALQFVEDLGMGVLFDKIEDFDFESLLDEIKYKSFLSSIAKYRNSFSLYKENLVSFFELL